MAKKMVLVEERLYDELWKRTPKDTSKTLLYDKLHSQLDSNEVTDDYLKAKEYQQNLQRFLNLKDKVPEVKPLALNGSAEEPKRKLIGSDEKAVGKKKRQSTFNVSKKTLNWDVLEGAVRRSKRKHIPWIRHD
jgi:glutaredoxin-related protein